MHRFTAKEFETSIDDITVSRFVELRDDETGAFAQINLHGCSLQELALPYEGMDPVEVVYSHRDWAWFNLIRSIYYSRIWNCWY